jgi:hypothetical protein
MQAAGHTVGQNILPDAARTISSIAINEARPYLGRQFLITSRARAWPRVPITESGLYIDHNGTNFSLLSIDVIGRSFTALTSHGDTIDLTLPGPDQVIDLSLSGPEWTDLQWVMFYYGDPGLPAAGFDQLVAYIPEPPSFGMFGISIAVFGWLVRRERGADAARQGSAETA